MIPLPNKPVKNGELRVLYHKPEKKVTKRPIVFLPGYVAAPFTWKDFHIPHHDLGEYYYVETREKATSKIKRNRKVRLDVEQSSWDLPEVIDYLGLNKRDHVLYGASYGGAVIFQSLIHQLVKSPTIVTFDPIAKWVYGGFFMNVLLRTVPLFILSPMRTLFAKISLANMKNQSQRDRMVAFLKGAEPWKFKQSYFQNKKFDIIEDLAEIKSELFICSRNDFSSSGSCFMFSTVKLVISITNSPLTTLPSISSRFASLSNILP